jgi:hypothetical protein
MADCVLCLRPVVLDPDTMSDGRMVHAGCKAQVTRVPQRRQSIVSGGARPEPTRTSQAESKDER